MKYNEEFLEGRLKWLAHTILEGDMWYSTHSPAEIIATYAIYCFNVAIKSAPRVNQDKQKIYDFKFARSVFRKYLTHCYNQGTMTEKLEKDIKKTFEILGKYYADLIDIYSLRYK